MRNLRDGLTTLSNEGRGGGEGGVNTILALHTLALIALYLMRVPSITDDSGVRRLALPRGCCAFVKNFLLSIWVKALDRSRNKGEMIVFCGSSSS